MSTLSLRLPNSLHDRVRKLAEAEGVSINQFISTAVAEKMSALMTNEYLTERAKRGDRALFEAALSRVPDVPAQEDDFL
jgi:predicted DNA-binding protein